MRSSSRAFFFSEGRLLRLATNVERKNMGITFPYSARKARDKPTEHEDSVETDDRPVAPELPRRATMIGIHFSASSTSDIMEGSRGG